MAFLASARVLKKRAAHSHLSSRTLSTMPSCSTASTGLVCLSRRIDIRESRVGVDSGEAVQGDKLLQLLFRSRTVGLLDTRQVTDAVLPRALQYVTVIVDKQRTRRVKGFHFLQCGPERLLLLGHTQVSR